MSWPLPRGDETDSDVFRFSIEATPLAKLQLGSTIGGDSASLWELGEDDEAAFRRHSRALLEAAYGHHFAERPPTSLVVLPAELERKLEIAALYVLCELIPADLAKAESPHMTEPTIRNWLNEALDLLDLPVRRSGHRAKA